MVRFQHRPGFQHRGHVLWVQLCLSILFLMGLRVQGAPTRACEHRGVAGDSVLDELCCVTAGGSDMQWLGAHLTLLVGWQVLPL